MNLAEAALKILTEHASGRPMHYRQITDLAVAGGLVKPRGLTPEASMNAAITTDIRRRADLGEPDLLLSYGRGFYGLARYRENDELEEAISRSNRDVRARLHAELLEMDPRAFEDLVGRLLTALGFIDVEVTKYSGDGGIDVRGTLSLGGITNVNTAIQVKRWAKNVAGRTVRELRGGLSPHERGLIMTTAGFTKDARSEATAPERAPISLVDGDALIALLVENGIGVLKTEARILRLDPASLLASEDDAEQGATEPEEPTRRAKAASSKNRSLWPLPGGRANLVQTMWAVLTEVSESEPTLDQFVQWVLDSFEHAKSRKAARSYIEMVRLAGLIEPRAGRFMLTADGAAALASTDPELLYRVMDDNVAGLSEALEHVRNGPVTTEDMRVHLNEVLGTSWQVDAQAKYRLWWLESFGKVRRVGNRYELAEES